MRGLMISFTIILFVLSVSLVNELNTRHETGRVDGLTNPLFHFQANAPFNTSSSAFSDVNTDDDMNSSLYDYTTPAEQPGGIFETLWSTLTLALQGVKFIIGVLLNSSVRFYSFIQTMGGTGITFVPDYVAVVLSIFVNISHMLVVIQFLTNRGVDAGA